MEEQLHKSVTYAPRNVHPAMQPLKTEFKLHFGVAGIYMR